MKRTSLIVVGVFVVPWFTCFAIGHLFDKEECRKAEANVVNGGN